MLDINNTIRGLSKPRGEKVQFLISVDSVASYNESEFPDSFPIRFGRERIQAKLSSTGLILRVKVNRSSNPNSDLHANLRCKGSRGPCLY